MMWVWSPQKAADNLRKHSVSFELGALALDDLLGASRLDIHPDGNRFQPIGRPTTSSQLVLFVVHTEPEQLDGAWVGRIISVRKANAKERRLYASQEF